MKLKIKKGDTVKVIAGNDKSDTPRRVLAVNPTSMRVLVEGVNIRKKHARPTQTNPKGGIIEMEMPIHYSNIMLLDSSKKATKVGIRIEKKDGKRVAIRFAKSDKKDI
jgi:large subunit ribosomal protein L24